MTVENFTALLFVFMAFSTKYAFAGLNCQDFLAGFSARVEPDGAVGNLKSVSSSEYINKNWLSLGTLGLENETDCNKRQKISQEGDHLLTSKEIGTSVDLGGNLLRKSIEPKFQLNSDSYDSEILRNQRQNFHAKSFDRPKLNPLFNFQGGIDVNQKSGILVPTRSNLKNDIDPLDNRLNLQNSATSSPASTSQNELQSRRDRSTLLDIPEFARSQGINYDKNKPNLYFEQPHVFSSDANEHSVAEVLLSLVAQKDKSRMPSSSKSNTNVKESYKKSKNGNFRQSEKKFGGSHEPVNIGHVQAESGGACNDSDQYHAVARKGKNVMQDNHSDKFENTKARTPERENETSLDTKYIVNEGAENEIELKLISSFESDLMKLLDLGTPLIQLDLIKEFELRAKHLNRKQIALSILQTLSIVENQIKEHGGNEFFVTDDEALKFLGGLMKRNFLTYYSKGEISPASNVLSYTTQLKTQLRGTDFSSLVNKILWASGANRLTFHQLKEWKKLKDRLKKYQLDMNLGKKSTIGKLFIVYSIAINKIFCNGPENPVLIERQVKALEFYHSVFGNLEANHNKLYKIKGGKDKYDLIRSGNNKAKIDSLEKDLYEKYTKENSNQTTQQLCIVWIMVELWLIQSRNELYQTLKNKSDKLEDNFKRFINNIVHTLLELNKKSFGDSKNAFSEKKKNCNPLSHSSSCTNYKFN